MPQPQAPKYVALLQERDALLKAGKALRESADTTTEQLVAHTAKVEENATALEAWKRADDAEARLPAAAAASGGAAPGYVSVTPRVERDPKRGFGSLGEFAMATRKASEAARTGLVYADERLAISLADDGVRIGAAAPSTLHQETNSTDGYMIPPDYRAEILKIVFEQDELLALIAPVPTTSNLVQFWADETTPWGAAGIVAYWLAEAGQYTATRQPTKGGELKLEKVGALVHCTDEDLEDAPRLTSRLNEKAPEAIAWTVVEAMFRGNGTGKPLGFEVAPSIVSVAKETSQPAATILPKNIAKMYGRLLRGPGAKIAWVLNSDTVPELIDLKVGNEPSWIGQNRGLTEAPQGMLLGDRIIFSEHAKTLGTIGDINLINASGYAAFIKSGGTRFDSSIHLYFDYGIQSFRWTLRVGGQPLLSAAISPANGSNTKSHFVNLATRA